MELSSNYPKMTRQVLAVNAASMPKTGPSPQTPPPPPVAENSSGGGSPLRGPDGRPVRRPEVFRPNPKARLLEQCREVFRFHHFSLRTEQTYIQWIRRFIVFHGKRHPREMGKGEIQTFLTHLAVAGEVAASTQNQALHALLFLYQDVLGTEPGWLDDFVRAKRP